MSRTITDEQLAAELESAMRRDYWRHFSVAELARKVSGSPARVRRVLNADSRFRSYAPVSKEQRERFVEIGKPWATYSLWD